MASGVKNKNCKKTHLLVRIWWSPEIYIEVCFPNEPRLFITESHSEATQTAVNVTE